MKVNRVNIGRLFAQSLAYIGTMKQVFIEHYDYYIITYIFSLSCVIILLPMILLVINKDLLGGREESAATLNLPFVCCIRHQVPKPPIICGSCNVMYILPSSLLQYPK